MSAPGICDDENCNRRKISVAFARIAEIARRELAYRLNEAATLLSEHAVPAAVSESAAQTLGLHVAIVAAIVPESVGIEDAARDVAKLLRNMLSDYEAAAGAMRTTANALTGPLYAHACASAGIDALGATVAAHLGCVVQHTRAVIIARCDAQVKHLDLWRYIVERASSGATKTCDALLINLCGYHAACADACAEMKYLVPLSDEASVQREAEALAAIKAICIEIRSLLL